MSIRDIAGDVDRWREEGRDVALATVVRTWGSGPRRPGAKMALTPDGRISGSVSGGCVEAAVVEEGKEVLETGTPRLLHFGVSDDTAWEVGLSCGGTLDVFVEPLTLELYQTLRDARQEGRALARAVVVKGSSIGESAVATDDGAVAGSGPAADAAKNALEDGRSAFVSLDDATDVFVDVELPDPSLVMVGGVHIAIAMTTIANALGFQTVLVDPRGVFGNEERFPHVDRLVHEWPDDALKELQLNRGSAVATLTHDPKLDDPALEVALRSRAFYVGALGSRRTHEKRRRRLIERGATEQELTRLYAPIGLSIGSRTPEEIALSVVGQIVAVRNGASP